MATFHEKGPGEYWRSGDGLHERIVIRSTADLAVKYSGHDSMFVFAPPALRDEHPGLCYQITDNRCPADQYPTLFVRLIQGRWIRPAGGIVICVALSVLWTLSIFALVRYCG